MASRKNSLDLECCRAVTNGVARVTKSVDQTLNKPNMHQQVTEVSDEQALNYSNGTKSNGATRDIDTSYKTCVNGELSPPKENEENLRNTGKSHFASEEGMALLNFHEDQYTAKTDPKESVLHSGRDLEHIDINNSGFPHPITSPGSLEEVTNKENGNIFISLEKCAKEIESLDFKGREASRRPDSSVRGVSRSSLGGENWTYTPPSGKAQLPDIRDKGYAWVTIAVMFLCNLATNGFMRSSGLICGAVVDAFPGTSTAHVSLIISLLSSTRNISAPLVGAASVHFGFRPVMLLGVVICSGALFLSAFCSSVTMMAFTLGAMMGTGMGVLETPHVQVLSHYFHEKKELAESVRVSANPMGGIILPMVLVSILEGFGLKLSFIILSGLMLQLVVFVCLIRPYRTHQIIVHSRQSSQEHKKLAVQPQTETEKEKMLQELERLKMIPLQEEDTEMSSVIEETKAKKFDFGLFTNPVYYTYIAMICCWALAFPHTFYFLPMFGKSVNLSPRQMSFILTYQSVFDFLCRIVTGFMLNKKMFGKRRCFFACTVIGGAGIAWVPFCTGVKTLLSAVSLMTLCCSGFFTCLNALLLDEFGRENIASSYGFMRMIQGIIVLLIPPFLGFLVDVTGNYTVTFLVMGTGVALAGVSIAVQPLVANCRKRGAETTNNKTISKS